jgi:hypothetical protein
MGVCRNGYLPKRDGKPNFLDASKPPKNGHFPHSVRIRPAPSFTPDSLRYLSCPSNLIGQDRVVAIGRDHLLIARGRGRVPARDGQEKQNGDDRCFRGFSISTAQCR